MSRNTSSKIRSGPSLLYPTYVFYLFCLPNGYSVPSICSYIFMSYLYLCRTLSGRPSSIYGESIPRFTPPTPLWRRVDPRKPSPRYRHSKGDRLQPNSRKVHLSSWTCFNCLGPFTSQVKLLVIVSYIRTLITDSNERPSFV